MRPPVLARLNERFLNARGLPFRRRVTDPRYPLESTTRFAWEGISIGRSFLLFLDPVAFPESKQILRRHLPAAVGLGTSLAVQTIMPFLARQYFHAANWQMTVITAAIPVMQFFSIYWNHFYQRVNPGTYLLALGIAAPCAIASIACMHSIWGLMAVFLVAAFGNAGLSPLNADLLRSCYAPAIRGRVFGLVAASQMMGAMLAGLGMGEWLNHHAESFRYSLPGIALIQITALGLCWSATRQPLFLERLRPRRPDAGSWWAPLRNLGTTLRADRRFAHYEIAFMSYGVGWMVCSALLPLLAADRLRLDYAQYARATVVAYQLTSVLLMAPVGRLADRIGPLRLSAASFAWLTIYPIGILFTTNGYGLGLFSVLYAIGMVGVQLTWTLGPVALARDASTASHYLAIHTTLVGVRGLLAQGLGMLFYTLTGSFALPLAGAAAAFAWAAWRMRRLGGSSLQT